MAVAAGEFGSDRAAFAIEFVAGAAKGGKGRLALRGIGLGDDFGGEAFLPVGDLGLERLGRVADFTPHLTELLGERFISQTLNLTRVEGRDRLAGNLLLRKAVEEDPRIRDTRDERVHRGRTKDGVAFPLIEDAVRHSGIIVVRETEDGLAAEDAVIGPLLQLGQEIGRGIANEVRQGGAAGSGIGLSVCGDGEQFITGAAIAEDDGEFANERLRFLVAEGFGDGVPGGWFRGLAPTAERFVETSEDGKAILVGYAREELVHWSGRLFQVLSESPRDEPCNGGEFGGEGEFDGFVRILRDHISDAIPDHEG